MFNLSQRSIVIAGVILISLFQPHARASKASVNIEPIIGYERVQKLIPEAHTVERMYYGARATAGVSLLSAEAELTRATDTETFSNQNLTVKDLDDRLKLGLRSSYMLNSLISLQARGGVQAERKTQEQTNSGVSTTSVGKILYHPYAGASLSSRLMSNLSLTGGVTVVFHEFPNMNKNDYQVSLGFSVRYP